jgi:hypothetical protein
LLALWFCSSESALKFKKGVNKTSYSKKKYLTKYWSKGNNISDNLFMVRK